MENTVFSLLPPVVAIVLAIATRRVLLSLGLGILTAAVLLAEFQFVKTIQIILETIKNVFVSGGGLNTWNVYILLFLFVLGIITAFITISGGSRAFGEWAMKRVKTRAGAQLVTGILGLLIFIDDYFNALAVGQVSRPITDRKKVSRAKLAYLIDSTSAPICVLSPVSSWGAYIISILGAIIASHQIEGMSAISMFVQMIPMNFYAIAAIIFVFMVISKNINYGPMKKHEERAATTGVLLDPLKAAPGELKEDLPVSSKGKVGDLVWPIVVLFAGTITAMFITGYSAS
ncbi:MAG: Na+/H+ antiporter NhaC family protein, partial [Firmicutes bacterium]|nr:Na+/H+ antiporter NhaC family protein [Bacillota bacterium]